MRDSMILAKLLYSTPAYSISIVHASWLRIQLDVQCMQEAKGSNNHSSGIQVQMGRALQEWEHLAAHFLWAAMVHFFAHTSRFRWQSLLVTHLAGGDDFFVDVPPPLGFSFSFSLFPLSSLLSFFSAPPPPAAGEGDDDGEDDPLLLLLVTTSSFFRAGAATAATVFALISASAEAETPTAARRMTTRSSSEASASRLLE